MAESLRTDARTGTESTHSLTEEREFCSSEAAEIFGMSTVILSCITCTLCVHPGVPSHVQWRLPVELIRDIKDPERSESLEALNVVRDDLVSVRKRLNENTFHICLEFVPTVPHCSLATTIGRLVCDGHCCWHTIVLYHVCVCTCVGLCLRVKLERCLHYKFKLDIFVTKGMHFTEGDGKCDRTDCNLQRQQ